MADPAYLEGSESNMATADDDQTLQLVEWREGSGEGGAAVISIRPPARASFAIRLEEAGGMPVIVLEGELDLATAPRLAAGRRVLV